MYSEEAERAWLAGYATGADEMAGAELDRRQQIALQEQYEADWMKEQQ